MRAFVGLPLTERLRAPLLSVQAAVAVGRAVPEDNLHLTLAFLGEISEQNAADLDEALSGRRLGACPLNPRGLATYGGARPKLLALDFAPEPALVELQRTVVRCVTQQAGLALERRRFRPHVTLIRFGSGVSAPEEARLRRALSDLDMPDLPESRAHLACLYRSHLHSEGAEYEILSEYMLT